MAIEYIRHRLGGLSIQNKLLIINLTVTMTALLFAVIMAVYSEYSNNRSSVLKSLLVQAKMVGSNTTAALVFDDPDGARDILQAFSESKDVQVAVIYDNNNKVLARYENHQSNAASYSHDELKALDNVVNTEKPNQDVGFKLSKDINIIHNIELDNETIGKLFIKADVSHLYDEIIQYLVFTSSMAMVGLGLASLLLLKLRRSITRPLQQLTGLMDAVTENNDYSIRAENESSDEIGILARGFNKMLKHIQLNDEKLAHELSERYKAEEHLDKLAYYDVVTGLPNRHFFHQKLAQAIEKTINNKSIMALLFLDLDNFKIVNDTLGHKTGDILLQQASSRLSGVVRQSDYICRIGGDEFAIIIENINHIDDTSVVTAKCIECLSKPFVFDGKNFFIGVSIGVSICPDDAITANDLLVNADMAMYAAKLNGKNNCQHYHQEMNVAHSKKYNLESDLRYAIEQDQFELHYQPQVDAQSGKLAGIEALMRWNHPQKGMINPEMFISVAEESGLILKLGEWLLKTACNHAKQMDNSGLNCIRLAVNISARQMLEPTFVDMVSGALKLSGVPPALLEFELTESILMNDGEILHSNVNKLKQLGISIVIDDFGTGFSSMGYLKSFPINMLKIDKSFISGLPDCNEDAAITQAIIAMSHKLNIKVIAEGVENKSQADLLREYSCDFLQGYYYARPMSFEELLKLESSSKVSGNSLRMIKGSGGK